MNQRQQQVGSLLKRVISDVVARRLSDPRLEGMISITRLEVSPDLRQALVYVSVFPDQHAKTSVFALNHATRHVHALVSKQVALRLVPHLEFRLDETLKKQAQVFAAIDRGLQREGPPSQESGPVAPWPGGQVKADEADAASDSATGPLGHSATSPDPDQEPRT